MFNPLSFSENLQKFRDLEGARKRAKNIRWKTIENLENYLIEFESAAIARGSRVWWANDTMEVANALHSILEETNASSLCRSEGNLINECLIDDSLRSLGWIPENKEIDENTGFPEYRKVIVGQDESENNLSKAEGRISFSEATFVISENAAAVFSGTGDTHGRIVTGSANQIILCDIFDLLPQESDLACLLSTWSLYKYGELLPRLVEIVRSAKRPYEQDGPSGIHFILVDNKRSRLLAEKVQREAAYCTDCDACKRVCPVYRELNLPQPTSTFTGPLGSVVNPVMKGWEAHKDMSYASSICGECSLNCPVHIDLHRLILYNRKDSVEMGFDGLKTEFSWKVWKSMALSRRKTNLGSKRFRKQYYNMAFEKGLGFKNNPELQNKKSFHSWWGEKKKG